MRYLYGDSVPFPQQFNFLSTLEAFVACASATLKLDGEIAQLKAKVAGDAEARLKSLAALETFHQGMVRFLSDGLKRSSEALITEYARQLQDLATQGVEGAKKACTEANDREQSGVRGDLEKKRAEIRGHLETFLRVASFTALQYSVTLRLEGSSNRVSAVLSLPKGITTGFSLAASQSREWSVPRRVSDISPGLVLKVGLKKGWMKKSVELEPVHLDDFFLSGFELDEGTAEIRLRRKPDQEDAFVFRARKSGDKSFAEVHRPLEEGAEAPPTPLESEDRVLLEKFWSALRSAVAQLIPHREALVMIALDGRDLFEHDRIVPFIERVVEILSPVLAEVDRRSPNPEELSLKVEDDRGRREEIYVRKADLLAKVETLPADLRPVFDKLGLSAAETLSATDVTVEVT